MKQYDPNWPFPQFDEEGVQLLPSDWDPEPPKHVYEDAPF